MEDIKINTAKEAVNIIDMLLQNADNDIIHYEKISLSEDLTTLRIEVKGDNYHGTVSGDLAKGLWELQQEIYRAIAFTITGTDDKRRLGRLPDEWRLQYEVRDGSTLILASIKWVINALKEGYLDMDDKHKTIVILGTVAILTSGYGLVSVTNNYIDSQTQVAAGQTQASVESANNQHQLSMEQEKTRQFEIISKAGQRIPAVHRWQEASTNGSRAVVKSVPDADSLQIGAAQINNHQIQEITARSARESSTTEPTTGLFSIVGFKRQDDGVSRFTVVGQGVELSVLLDAESFTEEQLNKLWNAAQHNTRISLEIQIKRIGESIRGAWVSEIPMAG